MNKKIREINIIQNIYTDLHSQICFYLSQGEKPPKRQSVGVYFW